MNKSEIIKQVAAETKLPATTVSRVLESIFGTMEKALISRDKVVISGFGTWTTSDRRGFSGNNPRTGESIEVPARTIPVFRAGKKLKGLLNVDKLK
ncbi:integration host factor subunit beta [Candidatus Pacearchaeota archaeon]|nr:integration host factor subunit beta [Candidatus Pacearchaeota archaeon]